MARTAESRRTRIAAENPEIAADLAEVVVDPPDRTFAETAYVDVGGRRVELRFLGRGHTDHDIVVVVPDAAVLFAGDLLEGGAVPFFGDAYPLDWPETAFRLAELPFGVVVPGHGDHAGRRFADDQAVAIAAIAEFCETHPSRGDHPRGGACRDALSGLPARGHPASASPGAGSARGQGRLSYPGRGLPSSDPVDRPKSIPSGRRNGSTSPATAAVVSPIKLSRVHSAPSNDVQYSVAPPVGPVP